MNSIMEFNFEVQAVSLLPCAKVPVRTNLYVATNDTRLVILTLLNFHTNYLPSAR